MNRLLLRFFAFFWLVIGITIGAAALGGYWYAERVRNVYDSFELGDAALEASAALRSAGRDGLRIWLQNFPETTGIRVLVLDGRGNELLDRPTPRMLNRMLDRQRRSRNPQRTAKDPDNLLRARPLTQLVGPDGERYTFVLVPARDAPFMREGTPARGQLLVLAIIVSAAASYLLARTLSRPVRRLREATQSLAAGDLGSRVAESVAGRNDELGLLARDFDQMAQNVERSAEQQAELARNVSHELRSPLARLRVALELARRQVGELAELDRIDLETERIDQLIGSMLEFSRLEAVADQQREVVSVRELVAEVVDDVNFEYADQAQGKRVTLEPGQDTRLAVYPSALVAAVENLLRNAARHTDQPVSISIDNPADGEVKIVVADRGAGVAEKDLERIFEPFARAGHGKGGTGLGLAIAKRVAQLHGGAVAAENRSRGGLKVTLQIRGAS